MSTYAVLSAPVESATEEKNSRFLTFLHPVASREEAKAHIDEYRKKYPDANHVCWAYVIGNTRQPQTQAFSDDGEPAGTAGRPILHVLTERDVGNSLAVVVRYFGGVKLGSGGLMRAYSTAVSTAVGQALLLQVSPMVFVQVVVNFAREAKIRHLVGQHEGHIENVVYTSKVTIDIHLPAAQAEHFTQQLTNETGGDAEIRMSI